MEDESGPLFDLEQVYDDQISPLMAQIIAICKEHKMPFLFTAMYQRHEELGVGCCTTALLYEERKPPRRLFEAHQLIKARRKIPMMKMTVIKADGSSEITYTAFVGDE